MAALLRVSLAAVASIALSTPAHADPLTDINQQKYGWREVWGGADATKDVWLLYTGVTLAPLSNDIYSDGLRFRVNSGYGQYQFDRYKIGCNVDVSNECFARQKVEIAYTDALVGYHLRLGELTAKAFVGASAISHGYRAELRQYDVNGIKIGATAGLEFWLNLGNQSWTSLDLFYTTAYSTGSARWRAGWRVQPRLSIGPEARYDDNIHGDASRIGAFARFDWTGGEISVAAGLAGAIADVTGDDIQPYVTLNILSQF